MNRREFLKLSVTAIAGEVFSLREISTHTAQVYEQQNLQLIRQLQAQPPTDAPQFGLVTDPVLPVNQVIDRFQTVTDQVGSQDYLGIFTVLNDFETPAAQAQLLTNWQKIVKQFPNVTLQIALGSSTSHANQHMLAASNLPWLEQQFQHVADTLQQFGKPVEVRFLFEMNTLGFIYSRGPGISDQDQATGFGQAAMRFDQILKNLGIRRQVKLLFNPTIYQPFNLYGQDPVALACFDEFSLDIYDYDRLKSIYVGNWLLPPGKTAPKDVIDGPVCQLKTLANGKKISVGEFGSFADDQQWMFNLLLRLAVENITKFTPFDVDKSSPDRFLSSGNWAAFPEADFRVNHEMAAIYQGVIGLLRRLQQAPNDQPSIA